MTSLRDKRILVTGASSGVGLAATRMLAAEGARLALVTRRLEALEALVAAEGLDALVIEADLAERGAGAAAVEAALAGLGGLDIVISNAASAVFGHTLEVHPDDFDRTVQVTFAGAADVIRRALPELRESRGLIVATGSLMTRVPLPTWGSYTAAKHALRGFLNTLAVEERSMGTGVRVAMIHPGPIDTPLFAHAASSTGLKPRIPPDAYSPETVAKALVAVCLDPRREVVLGGETALVDALYAHARPVAEALLVFIDRWYRSGVDEAQTPGSIFTPPQELQLSGGIPSRESLFAPVQLGRRLLPSPATPFVFARHMAATGVRAMQLAKELVRAPSERPVPPRSLGAANGSKPRPRTSGSTTV